MRASSSSSARNSQKNFCTESFGSSRAGRLSSLATVLGPTGRRLCSVRGDNGWNLFGPDHPLSPIVSRLATRAGLPQARCYVIPQASPNAFATGRNPKHAAVAATEGILRMLSEEELEGVLAHELAHVLRKIEAAAQAVPLDANPATAHMFIIKPFSPAGLLSLFSTHPPTEARIQALLNPVRQ